MSKEDLQKLVKKWCEEADKHSETSLKLLDEGNDEHKYFSGICYGLRIAAKELERKLKRK